MPLAIGAVGDVNPIDYGGGPIVQPECGSPHLEFYHGLDEECDRLGDYDDDRDERIERLTVRVYRVDLESTGAEFLSSHSWIDWIAVARTCGQLPSAYQAKHLDTPQARANALVDAASLHGWDNFDSYPLETTIADLRCRWDSYECHTD